MSKEEDAIETLLVCSENAREDPSDFARVVASSSWHEASTGWKKTAPNVIYQTLERKKKSKEKSSRSSPISSDHESHYQRVKKLAGFITNSSVQQAEHKTKSKLVKFRNVDVLSYDVPCWRYIIDPRTCSYVERKPLQVLRNVRERKSRTTILENGGAVSFQDVNGDALFIDPALSFDRHLLETLDHREDFRLKSDANCNSFDIPTLCPSYKTDSNRIRVVHTGFGTNTSPRVDLFNEGNRCSTCRHHTLSDSKNSELKPLQKITPTQRRAAEDSLLASRILLARAKELKSDSSTQLITGNTNKKNKTNAKTKSAPSSYSSNSRIDWVPITKSTINYQPQYSTLNNTNNHSRFPERSSSKFKCGKTVSFRPLHGSIKSSKLTLSEAANLMPGENNMSATLDKLAKELESKNSNDLGVGISFSHSVLPTVSGTKLVMLSETGGDN